MPYRNPEDGRSWKRQRYRQQRAERIAAGCCSKCGRRPAEPERRLCAECGARRRAADRARYARAKAEERPDDRKAESRRRAARAGARRRYEARQAAGLCTKCGLREPDEGRSRCEPCRGLRNAADRRQWASRLAAGLCGACGDPVPSGRARCEPCAAMQADRPSRSAYARKSTPGGGSGMRVSTARRPPRGPRVARAVHGAATCAPESIGGFPLAHPPSSSSRSTRAPP